MGRLANCMEFIKSSSSINLLSSKAEDLHRETRHLLDARVEVLEEVYRGKSACRNRRLVEHWLKRVIKVVHDVREFQSTFNSIGSFSLRSRYRLGRAIDKLLNEVLELQEHIIVLVAESIPDPIEPQTIPQHVIFGMEENFSKVQIMLNDEYSQIIGIYGMGGVGKTTLLIETYNHALEKNSDRFDLVIFGTASNYASIYSIQKFISGWLGFDNLYEPHFPKEDGERRAALCNALLEKKFLLLFDGLGEKLDLSTIGIPLSPASKKGSKIVFTTRSLKVCADMGATNSKVEVCRLSKPGSWKLFCEKVGKRSEEDWTGSSKSIAEEVAEKCRGLPLALITVGSAMAGATADYEWEEALTEVQGMSAELEEDIEYVLTLLKFSFDRLKDKCHKECLLYCALYPENYNIDVDELIDCWVGEGYLEAEGGSIDRARNHGQAVIATLKRACLLEDGNTIGKSKTVRLHEMVHKMVLWMTGGKCQEKRTIFLSNHRPGLESARAPETWTDAAKISLWGDGILEFFRKSNSQNLQTLFLRDDLTLRHVHNGFFQFTPCLAVLNLSFTGLMCLPPEISHLTELKVLNLSFNHGLKSLPTEIWRLPKLRMLNLNHTGLQSIPMEAIPLFSLLWSLKVQKINIQWREGWKNSGEDTDSTKREISLKDLDGLKHLEDLDLEIRVDSQEDWCNLRDSCKLRSVSTGLFVKLVGSIFSFDFFEDLGSPNQLTKISIINCFNLNQLVFPANHATKVKELHLMNLKVRKIDWKDEISIVKEPTKCIAFENLQTLFLLNIPLLEITWVARLPCLVDLRISCCDEMAEMITIEESEIAGVDKRDSFFPALRRIELKSIPNLKSISQKPLLFPKLRLLFVWECPMLRKLPFQLDSCADSMSVRGQREWWNELEWADESIQSKFSNVFRLG